MNATVMALLVLACLIAAVLAGRWLRRVLPEGHVSADSRDAVKLAMGLVATMSALVLGLLVSSAKGSYDTERSEVIQMASKISFLGRMLEAYGPEAAGVRTELHDTVEREMHKLWPGEKRDADNPAPNIQEANAVYSSIQNLSPQNDMQTALKSHAANLAIELAQVRALLAAQSIPSISTPMLAILLCWLVVIFLGFSVLAPPNATTMLALMVSAFAVSGAIFLILDWMSPLAG